MLARITDFALAAGNARRSTRATFPAAFARPTIEERILRFFGAKA